MKLEDIEKNNKIEVNITYNEYKKLGKIFPRKFFRLFLIPSIVWTLISLIALLPDEEVESVTVPELILSDIILVLCWLIISFIIILLSRKSDYKNKFSNKDNMEYTLYFYEDYILKKSDNISQKINYSDIKKYKDVDSTLYLVLDKNNIIPISKLSLDSNLINTIKYSIDNPSNVINKKDINEYIIDMEKKKNKYSIMNVILMILFILTLFTPWIALSFWGLSIMKNNAFDIYAFKYTYAALFAAPIPLSSLILGLIYNNKGLKCLKNIIAGVIMCFFVLIISSVSIISGVDSSSNYSDINNYKDIIGIELPKQGEYYRIKWDESYLQDHASSSAKFIDKEESNKFYEDVKRSQNWILKDDIGTTLNNFVPNNLSCYQEKFQCYYSIYNEELNSYNTIPLESGKYHIKSMLYDPNINTLKIEEFIYEYKN